MADQDRTAAYHLAWKQQLEETPYHFAFYAALRYWECLHTDKPRLGTSSRPADDPLRLTQIPALTFAPSALTRFDHGSAHRPPQLSLAFFGMFGPNGPLPLHLTEYARDRYFNARDKTFVRFLDVFHHRMASLLYRAWATTQPTVSFDRPPSDRFAGYVGALAGLGMPSLRNRDALPDLAKLHYVSRFSCQTRHPEGLTAILEDFLKLPVELTEFVGQWVNLPEDCRCQLGKSPGVSSLGMSVTMGRQVWDCQQKFRITVGPLSNADYERLLPGGESLRRMVAIVKSYIGDELSWDVKLILKKKEVPPLSLGQQGRMGWTGWMSSQPHSEDADDLLLDPLQHVFATHRPP
jgi:type VI secretion system protein ImpH